MKDLTPAAIVSELDKYIVGQKNAKKAVAIALRNRWRRQRVSEEFRDEIHPKNILMIGPTGVGKTEIARRLAKLVNAPFSKVEATKYTEIGYVGKDVESMIRDLVEVSVGMVKEEQREIAKPKAKEQAEERLLDLLVPGYKPPDPKEAVANLEVENSTREKFRDMLRRGELDDRTVELSAKEQAMPNFEVFAVPGMEDMDTHIRDMMSNVMPKRARKRKMKVKDALPFLEKEEAERLIDMAQVVPEALERAQNNGIVFLDEIDKIIDSNDGVRSAGNVSREGVQRDLLPIVEGTTVKTKHGMVKTDHILFIAAGAFHSAKPSDLAPELQGRFPIRVELQTLSTDDFIRILSEPRNSLPKQYVALMDTEEVAIVFREDAIQTISQLATSVNEKTENIGARRLHTIIERVLEEVSFNAPEIRGQTVEITQEYVEKRVNDLIEDTDLSRYIL